MTDYNGDGLTILANIINIYLSKPTNFTSAKNHITKVIVNIAKHGFM